MFRDGAVTCVVVQALARDVIKEARLKDEGTSFGFMIDGVQLC
jgi:hypothetical protein